MPQSNPTASPRRGMWRSLVSRLHRDDRGNLGILLLMTVWTFVVLLAMVWNTGEFATRRRHVQNAADAAVHAGNLWVSRTSNLTASTNMVLSENGSAEVILRSVQPTIDAIQSRLDSELKRANLLLTGSTQGSPEKNIPDTEFFQELIGFGNWQGKGRGTVLQKDLATLVPQIDAALKRILPLLDAAQAARLKQQMVDGVTQNTAAMDWIINTYIAQNGAAVSKWITGEVEPRLDDIISTINPQQQSLDQFTAQIAPALAGMTTEQLHEARQAIWEYQQQIRALTPQVIEEQRSALASFYKVDLTIAKPGMKQDTSEPAMIDPPVVPADQPTNESHSDTIRERYPNATAARFGSSDPTVDIDPINVNDDRAIIWHPGSGADAPTGIMLKGQEFSGTFGVGGGEWGRVLCAPLARYFNERIWRDEQGLRKEPQAIDQTRRDLRSRIWPVPLAPGIDGFPNQFTLPAPSTQRIGLPPARIPSLPTPQGLTPAEITQIQLINTAIAKFDSDMRKYVQDLRLLPQEMTRMYTNLFNLANSASTVFADWTWLNNVEANRVYVLREIGQQKEFMILPTYSLRKIPDWAVEDMRQSVHDYVYRVVYDRSLGAVTRAARAKLKSWAKNILDSQPVPKGQGRPNNTSAADQFANQNASQVAQYVVGMAAETIATEVAAEWVLRPWPFEITPPTKTAPPTPGLSDDDRKNYFTFLTAAQTNSDTAAKPMLPKSFTLNTKPLVAFAQGEDFNWMEFNGAYGSGDNYNKITSFGHGDMGGSPRPWRLSTIGGWNWQPRISLADALGQAMQDGPEFRSYLENGGVTGDDQDAIKTLTLH